MLSLVIPVYNNEESLPRLFTELEGIAGRLGDELEIVFVVDGAPDRSLDVLRGRLPQWHLRTQLVELSRNFGSFAAIAAGLQRGTGDWLAVLAAYALTGAEEETRRSDGDRSSRSVDATLKPEIIQFL